MPVEPTVAVLTAAILANLGLMVAILVAPAVRRRQEAVSQRWTEVPDTARSVREDAVHRPRRLVVASAPEAPDEEGPDRPDEPAGGAADDAGELPAASPAGAVAAADPGTDEMPPGDTVERDEMTDRPDPLGTEQPRRFPVVMHHDPHAGRTIEAFLSSVDRFVPDEGEEGSPGDLQAPDGDLRLAPDGLLDPLTGLDGPVAWERGLRDEDARLARYRRATTVVLIELDGLRRLTDRFGQEPAARLLPAVADALRREARGADHVARLGWARFGVLLPETDEIQAINYVERVRASCDRWLESGAVALRLAIGWASPAATAGLDAALRVAEQRLFAERRHGPDASALPPAPTGTEGRP